MIKCSLIDITTDNRAVIVVGEDPHAEVKTTPRLRWLDYHNRQFAAGMHTYSFEGA